MNKLHETDDSFSSSHTVANRLHISDSTLNDSSTSGLSQSLQLWGGEVKLSNVKAEANNSVFVSASSGFKDREDESTYGSTYYNADGMNATVLDSSLKATNADLTVHGKTVTVDGDSLLSAGTKLILVAGSEADYAEITSADGKNTFVVTAKDGTDVLLGKNVKLEGEQIIKPGLKIIGDTPSEPSTTPKEPTQPSDPGNKSSEPAMPADTDAAKVVAAFEQGQTVAEKRAVVREAEPMARGAELARQKQSEEAGIERVERMPRPQADAVAAADTLPVAADTTANVTVDGTAED